jgi:hypothetical protein
VGCFRKPRFALTEFDGFSIFCWMSKSLHSSIVGAIARFMRPLARALLRNGVGYRDFENIAKKVFVNVAMDEFGVRGRPTNTSRIAIMTGMTRKEVRTLRESSDDDCFGHSSRGSSAAAEVLHVWFTDARFNDSEGAPKPLAFSGGENSFSGLVKLCTSDVPPGAMRAELSRVGAIGVAKDGCLTPTRREVVPVETESRLLEGLNFGLAPLAETISFNSDSRNLGRPRFQRVVHTKRLDPELAEQAEKAIRERLVSFSEDLDTFLGEYELSPDHALAAQALDAGVGFYYFVTRESAIEK